MLSESKISDFQKYISKTFHRYILSSRYLHDNLSSSRSYAFCSFRSLFKPSHSLAIFSAGDKNDWNVAFLPSPIGDKPHEPKGGPSWPRRSLGPGWSWQLASILVFHFPPFDALQFGPFWIKTSPYPRARCPPTSQWRRAGIPTDIIILSGVVQTDVW